MQRTNAFTIWTHPGSCQNRYFTPIAHTFQSVDDWQAQFLILDKNFVPVACFTRWSSYLSILGANVTCEVARHD